MKINNKIKRKLRNRKKLKKVNENRFRISVSKSLNNLSAQIIDDKEKKTLVSASTIEKDILSFVHLDSFNQEWVKDLRLLLPCENVNLSKKSSRLPNAPRKYRNGTHRGIDFFANLISSISCLNLFPLHSSHTKCTSAINCISIFMLPSPFHLSHLPPSTLNEKYPALYFLFTANF